MKCFSLFSGIGGFDLALKNKGHEIVGCCEIDDFARQIYAKHFGTAGTKDATKLDPLNKYEVPDHDLLCAGFPCQAFSVAGRRLGFEESRGTLFFEIARIAKQKRPKFLLLENVKGLLSHDNGKTFANILATLDDIGYDAEWQVLNSKYWVPQNRERIFIIGYLRGQPRPKVFPFAPPGDMDKRETPGEGEQPFISNAIDANYWKGPDKHGQRTVVGFSKSGRSWGTEARLKVGEANTLSTSDGCSNKSSFNYVVEPKMIVPDNFSHKAGDGTKTRKKKLKDISPALQAKPGGTQQSYVAEPKLKQVGNIDKKGHNSIWGRVYDPNGISSTINAEAGGLGAKTGLYKIGTVNKGMSGEIFDPKGIAPTLKAEGGGLGAKTGLYAVPIKFLNRNQKNMPKDQAMTIDTHNSSGITDGVAIRKLTPLECERLQGFPDGWTEGISDTQRYRCLGNAVTVPVVEYILEHF